MTARIEFFPVDNGDMTLITLESGRKILIDCKIRVAADDEDDDTPDVAKFLRDRLDRDAKGRPYVDVFLLSHPDQDHCSGIDTHFHLGKLSDYPKKGDKIVIREMWSSPLVFRRKDRCGTLCPDAEAWRAEARRRVQAFRDGKGAEEGNRILVLGEDIDHKTDGLDDIMISLGEVITAVAGEDDGTLTAVLLGPLSPHKEETEEELLAKNRSSVIMQFTIAADKKADACLFLCGGDAEVAIWERQWKRNAKTGHLNYDVLLTPHHCSWHSLSYDSWSELGEKASVSQNARSALAQGREGAILVASSCAIKDNDIDPPCIRAKREYVSIAKATDGSFEGVAEYLAANPKDEVLLIEIAGKSVGTKSGGGSSTSASAMGIGSIAKTEKGGGGRYARSEGRFC